MIGHSLGCMRGKKAPYKHTQLDLDRAPYVLYGVKYIDLVSLGLFKGKEKAAYKHTQLDLNRPPLLT